MPSRDSRLLSLPRGVSPPDSKLFDCFDKNKNTKEFITNFKNAQLGLHEALKKLSSELLSTQNGSSSQKI
jgi:hypothetical protein